MNLELQNLNLSKLSKENAWLKKVIKAAMQYAAEDELGLPVNDGDVEMFIADNTPEIEIPQYADDDYEGKEAYQAGRDLWPEKYVNGANEDLKKGWHAREHEEKQGQTA